MPGVPAQAREPVAAVAARAARAALCSIRDNSLSSFAPSAAIKPWAAQVDVAMLTTGISWARAATVAGRQAEQEAPGTVPAAPVASSAAAGAAAEIRKVPARVVSAGSAAAGAAAVEELAAVVARRAVRAVSAAGPADCL